MEKDDGFREEKENGMDILNQMVDICYVLKEFTGPIMVSFGMNGPNGFNQELNIKIMNNDLNFEMDFSQLQMTENQWIHKKEVKLLRKRNKKRFGKRFQSKNKRNR